MKLALNSEFTIFREAMINGKRYLISTQNCDGVHSHLKDHFKKLHDLDVKVIDGIAIMTDTDNSKLKAISYYQNIYFSSE